MSIEDKLISTYNLGKVDILKVGHHGSITSSSESFLDAVISRYAVVQAGVKNKFNHPSKIVMDRLEKRGVKTFLTSTDGSVRFDLHKEKVTFKSAITYDILGH